jgi:broad specificity phosphatase PhoE
MHPLSGDRVREFIRLRIKNDEVVENVFQWLSRDHTLVKLAENPLNLSIIAIVSTEGGGIRGLNKTKLYERALECIVRQHYRENPYERYLAEDVQPLQIELILQHLAYNTISSEGRFFSQRELDKAAKSVLDVVPSGLSRLLSGRLGIIRDRKAGRMEFFHLWYQEFLAARYIIESDEDIIEQLNNKKLAGVLPYIVGLHPDTTFTFDLLKKIGIHDPFNFCRAIGEGCFSDDQIYELIRRIISFGESQKPKIPVRIELSRAISQLSFNGINSLIKIVKDEQLNDYTRRAALEALSILQIKREQFESVLLDILETSSLGLLWHVLEHIGKNKVKGALGKLLEYKNHPNPIVAGDVIWGINEIRENKLEELPPNVVESLIQCLSSDDLHLQGHALRTLGRLRIANAIPRLKDHLANKEAGYRWIVPEAAALIAVAESLEIFNVAIDDHDTKVVAAALKGLAEYDGTVSEHILNKIKSHFDDENWISFLEQPLGIVARLTFEKLVNKRKPQNIARVFVSRHCKTSWNLEGRLQGTKDLSLSEEGRKEALDNVKNISELRIDRIVTSNSKRAYETAQIYAEKLGIPVHIHPGLRELDHGRWEGVRINDLLNDESSNYRKWLDNPTGVSIPDSVESITTAQQRILEAIRNIALRYNGENVLVITHKHIRALLKCAINNYGLEDFENRIEESIEPHEIERTKLLRLCGTEMEIL